MYLHFNVLVCVSTRAAFGFVGDVRVVAEWLCPRVRSLGSALRPATGFPESWFPLRLGRLGIRYMAVF